MRIVLHLPYPPKSGNHANKIGAGRVYKTEEAEAFKLHVKAAIRNQSLDGLQISERCSLHFVVWPPDEKGRDADNVLKPVQDALTYAGLLSDDSNKIIRRTLFEWQDVDKDEAPGGAIFLTIETTQ